MPELYTVYITYSGVFDFGLAKTELLVYDKHEAINAAFEISKAVNISQIQVIRKYSGEVVWDYPTIQD